MSRLKIKKLSTGVQSFSPAYSEKVCTPNNNNTQRIKKEKRKKDFPALKAGNGSTPEPTQKSPNLFLGVPKIEKRENAGVGLAFVEKLLCKKKVAIFWPEFYFVRLLCCK